MLSSHLQACQYRRLLGVWWEGPWTWCTAEAFGPWKKAGATATGSTHFTHSCRTKKLHTLVIVSGHEVLQFHPVKLTTQSTFKKKKRKKKQKTILLFCFLIYNKMQMKTDSKSLVHSSIFHLADPLCFFSQIASLLFGHGLHVLLPFDH